MALATILIRFTLSAAAVVVAGVRLARDGDAIAARTRLGGLWVGSVFLAVATSLPELTTDIAAIRFGVPDLAAGDLFGSSMANMLILAVISLLPGADLLRRAALDNNLSASLAITLTGVAALFLLLGGGVTVAGIGLGSIILAVGYLAGVRTVFLHSTLLRTAAGVEEMAPEEEGARPERGRGKPLRGAIVGFIAASIVILVAAPVFASSAKAIAEQTGLEASFVGTWLVGLATSLPELVTSLAAVRRQAWDLAVGNLFGSNALNMSMFLPLDIADGPGPLLGAVSGVHVLSALFAILLMAIGVAAITYRARRRFAALEPSAILMMIVYVLGLLVIQARSTMF